MSLWTEWANLIPPVWLALKEQVPHWLCNKAKVLQESRARHFVAAEAAQLMPRSRLSHLLWCHKKIISQSDWHFPAGSKFSIECGTIGLSHPASKAERKTSQHALYVNVTQCSKRSNCIIVICFKWNYCLVSHWLLIFVYKNRLHGRTPWDTS